MQFIALSLVLAAGANDPAPTFSSADMAFFEGKVRPVLVERCHKCHADKKQRGGLRLDGRAHLLSGGDSGPALVPGDPAKSLLVKAIHGNDPLGVIKAMPPSGKLPAKEIAILEEWVRRGAPYPTAHAGKSTASAIDLALGRKFWSFQPVRPLPAPATKDRTWAAKPADAFVLAELEKRGLTPSPPADRRTLLRRAYFDLLGLPPAPGEVERFVQDSTRDAYPKVIDKLLASPHYGERWGRHWLDLVRYCDIGEDYYPSRAMPYLYRDWVIRAVNDDVPYDRFVRLQFAADLMADAKPADRAALGFLGLSPLYWKELKLDHVVIKTVVAEEWEERIHTIASTFLGLTVACARCHDHKFDPITMHDYYGLAGVLASTRLADRYLLPDDRAAAVSKARAQVAELEKRIAAMKSHKKNALKATEASAAVDKLKAEIAAIKKATPDYEAPMAAGLEEASLHVLPDGPHRTKLVYKANEPQDVAMQVRGNPGNLGPVVPRHFLSVLSTGDPRPLLHGSGRLDLADAIVTDAASLAARVFVNRVWKHHFGTGLVETPSDFGQQGERPSHPALLDDLAARFIQQGWSLKWLHREIMLSATYQQASAAAKHPGRELDPGNRLYWRMNRRRLDVEAWRDAMLAVAGTLERTQFGPPKALREPDNNRRTVYGTVKRRETDDLLRLHDFPDPTIHSPNRVPTTTPLQQLFTLNSPLLRQQAVALANRLQAEAGAEARIRRAYALLFGRSPSPGQMTLGLEFLRAGGSWEQYTQALLASNEFLFVD